MAPDNDQRWLRKITSRIIAKEWWWEINRKNYGGKLNVQKEQCWETKCKYIKINLRLFCQNLLHVRMLANRILVSFWVCEIGLTEYDKVITLGEILSLHQIDYYKRYFTAMQKNVMIYHHLSFRALNESTVSKCLFPLALCCRDPVKNVCWMLSKLRYQIEQERTREITADLQVLYLPSATKSLNLCLLPPNQ
jgi:hypothetical protein